MTDLDDLEKKAREATPGPWVSDCEEESRQILDPDEYIDVSVWQGVSFEGKFINNIAFDNCIANADYIAAANPSAILDLIARCRKAEARVAELEAQSGEVVGYKHAHLGQFIGVVRYQQLDAETKANYLPLYLRAPQAVPEWQPIETAPKDGTKFLGYKHGQFRECYKVQRSDCDMWCFGHTSGDHALFPNIRPNHWMPLPAAPSPEGE